MLSKDHRGRDRYSGRTRSAMKQESRWLGAVPLHHWERKLVGRSSPGDKKIVFYLELIDSTSDTLVSGAMKVAGRIDPTDQGPPDRKRSAIPAHGVWPFLWPHRGRLTLGRPFKAGIADQNTSSSPSDDWMKDPPRRRRPFHPRITKPLSRCRNPWRIARTTGVGNLSAG